MIGADQVVRSRLGSGIWAIGRVRSGFRERRVVGSERSVDFIGRNVQKAKSSFLFSQGRAIRSGFLQQAECAVHIGANEIVGAVDGAVHVTLGGEMDNGARTATFQEIADQFSVGDISVYEAVARI